MSYSSSPLIWALHRYHGPLHNSVVNFADSAPFGGELARIGGTLIAIEDVDETKFATTNSGRFI